MKKILLVLMALPALSWGRALPLLIHSHENENPNSTYYFPPGNGVLTGHASEARAQIPIYSSGIISGMWVRLESNSLTGGATFTLRINGSSRSQTVSFLGGVSGISSDTTHSDVVNYGDKIDFEMRTGAGTSIQPLAIQIQFTPKTAINYQRYNAIGWHTITGATNGFQPYYEGIAGVMGNGTGGLSHIDEGEVYYVMRGSGTFRNLAVYVTSNTRTTTIPFTLRKNGADTSLPTGPAAGYTGLFEDKTNTVTVVAGDTVTWKFGMNTSGDTNPISVSFISAEYIANGNEVDYPQTNGSKNQDAGQVVQLPYQAALTFGGDEYQVPAFTPGTFSRFCVYTAQNTCSTASSLQVKKNGTTDGNILVTIPATSTGTFCDNTHTITVVSTDSLTYLGSSPAGTGTMYYSSIGSLFLPRGPSDPLYDYQIFPSNNVWFTRADDMPVSSSNTLWMDTINGHTAHDLHADFGSANLADGTYNGIPYNIVFSSNAPKGVALTTYASESDTQPTAGLPLPDDVIVEGDPLADSGSDRHLILVDRSLNRIYEMFGASRTASGVWQAAQLTIWVSSSNALRQAGWTSADAGGLPILPGLVRWDEVKSGVINHALRFTLSLTHGPYMWPGRHDADSGGSLNPPFGMRVRLKNSVDISGYSATNQVIFTAMKKYGMILADNGGDWYVSGAPSPYWDDTDLHDGFLGLLPVNSFEVVDESTWIVDPNTADAKAPGRHRFNGGGSVRGGVKFR